MALVVPVLPDSVAEPGTTLHNVIDCTLLVRRMVLHFFRTSVGTVTVSQLKLVENRQQLRKVSRAMRNFSYFIELFC